MINVAIDVYGGDLAPRPAVDGAYEALKKDRELRVILLGPKDLIKKELSSWDAFLLERAEIIDAPQTITTEEHPTSAIKKKPDSGIVKGLRMVKEGEADAFISAGSSGAILAGGLLIVGRIKGVMRPPLASLMPTARGRSLFLDCGANMDAKPEWLMQYARMGSVYMEKVEGLNAPSVYLANVGPEEEKGNKLIKEANSLLKGVRDINYKGFIEFRDIPLGTADIVVADAFTGNAIIKTYEGAGKVILGSVKDVLKSGLKTRIGAMLIMKPLKAKLSDFDAAKCGGALMLGLNGLVIKCHGNADALEISTSVAKALKFKREDVNGEIRDSIEKSEPGMV